MRGWVLHKQGPVDSRPLALEDLETPPRQAGELLLKVEACGVCLTDLHILEGDLPLHKTPIIPGHQIVGRAALRGEDESRTAGINPRPTDAPNPGLFVGVPWLSTTCPPDSRCKFCAHGQENLCERATFTGYDRDGGYAEYVSVPAESVYPLPAYLDPVEAAPLLCSGVIGYRALKLATEGQPSSPPAGAARVHGQEMRDPSAAARECTPPRVLGMTGEKTSATPPFVIARSSGMPERRGNLPTLLRVGLYGFGSSAHLVLQMARHFGHEVFVFSRSEGHRALARKLGAAWAGGSDQSPPAKLDASVLFAPAGALVPVALAHLDRGGVLCIAGIHLSPIPALDYSLLYHERVVRSAANSTRADVRETLALAAEMKLKPRVEVFDFKDAPRALERVKRGGVNGSAVLRIGA